MKKIILISTVLLLCFGVNAQEKKETKSPLNLLKYSAIVESGQSFRYGDKSVTSPYNMIKSGVTIELPIHHYGFGIETGLKYNYGFGKREQRYAHNGKAKYNYSAHLIDVPVRLTFTFPLFWNIKLYTFTGANFNIGLAQTEEVKFTQKKVEGVTNVLPYPKSGTYNLYENDYSRFNFQLGAGGGLQWHQFRIRGGYDWGLNDLYKPDSRTEKMKGWYVGLEYVF